MQCHHELSACSVLVSFHLIHAINRFHKRCLYQKTCSLVFLKKKLSRDDEQRTQRNTFSVFQLTTIFWIWISFINNVNDGDNTVYLLSFNTFSS